MFEFCQNSFFQNLKVLLQFLFWPIDFKTAKLNFDSPYQRFPSATNNVRPIQGGAAAAARRRHGLEVEDEGLLKDLVIIFVFLEVFYIVRCFF